MFIFDQLYIPHTNREQEILRNQIKGKPPQTYLQADRKWIFGQNNDIFYYQVFDPDTNQLRRSLHLRVRSRTPSSSRAASMPRTPIGRPSLHKWVFEQGWMRTLSGTSIQDYRTFDVATFNELHEDPSYFKKEVKQSSEMNYEELQRYISDLQQSGFDTVRLKVQLQKKIAFPLITLVMAVLAVPFAASGRKGGALGGVVDRGRHRRGVLGDRRTVRGHGQRQSTARDAGGLGARLYLCPRRRLLPVAGADVKQLSAFSRQLSAQGHRIRIGAAHLTP